MLKLSHNQLVRGLQIVNHCILLFGIFYAISVDVTLIGWAIICYWIVGTLGINVGFHRLLAHRSFRTSKPVEMALSVIGCITTVGSPLAWVAVHRQHHVAADSSKDIHSPYFLGNWRAWFGFWNYPALRTKLVNDLRKNSFQKFLHKYYLLIILSYIGILAVIDPVLVIFLYCIPACLCLHSSSAIIVIAHKHGYQPYKLHGNDQARNSWIANLFTLGEGWHNTHHAKPYAWNNWERWWEFDIPSLIIRLIKKADNANSTR